MSVTTRTTHKAPEDAWNHIFSQGFIELPIDPAFLNGVVPTIMEGMTRITTNPSYAELFKLVILGTDEVGWGQDSGLIRRSDDEKKWFFHYCGDITYSHLDASGAPVHFFDSFFAALAKVNERARQHALHLARMYDAHGSCPSGKLAPRVKSAFCLTRVLRYLKRDDVKAYDANIHFDRGFVTVHWVSTQPGLVLFGPDGTEYRARETAHDSVTLFPSKKFAAVTRGAHGFGTAHGVKNPARHTAQEDRFALVSFVHIPLTDEDVAWLNGHQEAMEQAERSLKITI